MRLPSLIIVFGALGLMGADCVTDGPTDAGPDVPPPCFIGDETAEAEIQLVYRTIEGNVEPLVDGQVVPLIRPIQGGKVTYIGIRAKNISCNVQLNGGFFDDCRDPPIVFGRDARPVTLVEGADGFGEPVNDPADPFVVNLVNVPVCPAFVAVRDQDRYPTRFELRVTEARRPNEDTNRTHLLSGSVIPECAEPDLLEECQCECDADYLLELPNDEQCPTIHENDLPADQCPELTGEGEGE
jgi:hypothetical protein